MEYADTSDGNGEDAFMSLSKVKKPLLLGERSDRTRYGSDGELESSPNRIASCNFTDVDVDVDTYPATLKQQPTASQDPEDGVLRERETSEGTGERPKNVKCGFVYCFQKVMDQLPAIGEDDMEESSEQFEELLRFGAWQVVQLILPVFICMAVVVVLQLTIAVYYTGPQGRLLYLPYSEDSSSGGINFLFGIVNAIVFVALVVVMTIVLVLLFKYRCNKVISVWLLIASGSLLFVVSSIYFVQILIVRDLTIDWLTFILVIWNFGILGLMVIHWKGPLRLQQAYLITCSALVATVLIRFIPDWTTWIILAAISVYDLFAVMCKKGPLRILVDIAKERGEINFPSLIYSSTMMWLVTMADVDPKSSNNRGAVPRGRPQKGSSGSGDQITSGDEADNGDEDRTDDAKEMVKQLNSAGQSRSQEHQRNGPEDPREGGEDNVEEKRGFKLGLGDFIFYSVLVGKAAHESGGNWVIISSCFVAILIGLCLTSLILGIVRRALPALPFSIFFGLVFYFTSQYIISPYVEVLNVNQVFI